METIIFCWVAPVCAIVSGCLLGLCQRYNEMFNRWPNKHYLLVLKILLSLFFLISLITGYLGSINGLEGKEQSLWTGILGATAMVIPAYLGHSAGYHKLLFKSKEANRTINYIANAAYLLLLISCLAVWYIKIELIVPAALFWTALAAGAILIMIIIASTICIGLAGIILFSLCGLTKTYWQWLND